jgi:hypothetical protein
MVRVKVSVKPELDLGDLGGPRRNLDPHFEILARQKIGFPALQCSPTFTTLRNELLVVLLRPKIARAR